MALLKKKKLLFLLFIPLVVGALIGFQALVDWQTAKVLSIFQGYTSTYDTSSLYPFSLTWRATNVKIVKDSAGGADAPFFMTEAVEFSVDWSELLLHQRVVAQVSFEGPSINFIAAPTKAEQQADPEIPNLGDKLIEVLPLKVQRVSITHALVTFVDKTQKDFPRVEINDLDATLENLSTRASLAKGEPTIIAVYGIIQKTAPLTAWVSMDPLAKGLFFSGRFKIADLPLADLKGLISSETGLQFDRGTLDVFAQFDCNDGNLKGGIKPLIKNGHVVPGKPGLINLLKTVLVDVALGVLSDGVPGRDAVATVIPISGRITKPDIQVGVAVIGVIRNAFVQAVVESYSHLPLPEAGKEQGALIQVIDGLNKDKGPPKAQPPPEAKR